LKTPNTLFLTWQDPISRYWFPIGRLTFYEGIYEDDEHGQYLILDIGGNGDNYLHATPIHISLIDDKVWIQYDDTEEGVVSDLMAAGIVKEDIVLGFRHPKVRQFTGFAVA
jgi:XisI protein